MATLVGQKKGKKIDVSTNGERLIYSATREYIVYDQSGVDGEGDILGTPGVPLVNQLYQFDGVPLPLLCKSKSAQQFENNNRYWTISAEFDNEPVENNEDGSGQGENDSADPTTWFAIARIDFEKRERVFTWFENFAKRPYSPPLSRGFDKPVIKWTQYLPSSITLKQLSDDYTDVVNLNAFLGERPRRWLLNISGAEYGTTNGFECWKCNFELRRGAIVVDDGIKVYDEAGLEIQDRVFSEWDFLIPQMDTIDKFGNPFTDVKENSGDIGKLDVTGGFLADQEDSFILQRQQVVHAVDFSWIRIRQAQ